MGPSSATPLFDGTSDAARPTFTLGPVAGFALPKKLTMITNRPTLPMRGARGRITSDADSNSTRKLMPQGPVTDAHCKIGRLSSCVWAKLPAVPCTHTRLIRYSIDTQAAG